MTSEIVSGELDVSNRELLGRRVERRLERRETVVLEHVEKGLREEGANGRGRVSALPSDVPF